MTRRSVTQGHAQQENSPTSQLSPLEKPHFFSGQLLTDQDLNRLLQWTERKFGLLNSKRLGWGIVDGLTVHIDKERKGGVRISPGCAVDAQGYDVLLELGFPYDLEKVCLGDAEGCEDLAADRANSDEPIAVDLYIRHKTDPGGFQKALGQNDCRDTTNCNYTYITESAEIFHTIASKTTHLDPFSLASWDKRFGQLSQKLLNLSLENIKQIKQELRAILMDATMQQFCFMESLYKKMSSETAENATETIKREAAEILFWLIQDARNSYLAEKVSSTTHIAGIPLARVWLKRGEDNICDVLAIDACAPWRRPYQPHDDPYTMAGQINLGQFIWCSPKAALSALQTLGVKAELVYLTISADTSRLKRTLTATFKGKAGEFYLYRPLSHKGTLRIVVLDTAKTSLKKELGFDFGQRVIGFYDPTLPDKIVDLPDDSEPEPPQNGPDSPPGGSPPPDYDAPQPPQPPPPSPKPPVQQEPPMPPPALPEPPPVLPKPPVESPSKPPTIPYAEKPTKSPVAKLQEDIQRAAKLAKDVTDSEQVPQFQELIERYDLENVAPALDLLREGDLLGLFSYLKNVPSKVDILATIKHIGSVTAQNLYDEGITTPQAVNALSDDELKSRIPGLNPKKIEDLRFSIQKTENS